MTAAAHLGDAMAALHRRLVEIHAIARGAARRGIRRIMLAAICGDYHDLRSMAPMPKAELVAALRALPDDPGSREAIAALVADVLAGAFADAPAPAPPAAARASAAAAAPPAPPALTDRQRAVLGWLCRYREVYGRSPTAKEIAGGLSLSQMKVCRAVGQLERKGALVRLEGLTPTRAP